MGRDETQVQADKKLAPKSGEVAAEAAAAAPSSSKTTGAGKDKATKSRSTKAKAAAAVAARGEASWADRLRDFQMDIPASTAYNEPTSNSEEGAGAGAGGDGVDVGAEQDVVTAQQGEEEDDPVTWDGVGVDAATVILNRKQFDIRCKAYEVGGEEAFARFFFWSLPLLV